MDNSTLNVQAADLEPVVRQILDQPTVEILDWSSQSFTGSTAEHVAGGLGVHRISGTARHDTAVSSWSVVLKASRPNDDEGVNDPAMWNYWKREVLAYQSGVLNELPGNLVAPVCYAIQETSDGAYRLWLEDIREAAGDWTMAQHQLAAHHLGQFNGAYLTGHPLPERESWMLPGREKYWIEMALEGMEQLPQLAETELGRWISKGDIERMLRLWANREALLSALDRLPTCFCHHDAFRRNLMLRQTDKGTAETVAIDWAYTGPGKVGQEIGITTAVNLQFMEVAASSARELDQAVFEGYIDGLRDAGWQGDRRLARFGYATTAALTMNVAGTVSFTTWMQAQGSDPVEAVLGYPIDDIMDQWAAKQPFMLDLGDEALALMDAI